MGENKKIQYEIFHEVKQNILACVDVDDQREILKGLIEELQVFQEVLNGNIDQYRKY